MFSSSMKRTMSSKESLFAILTTIWYKIIFWTQNRKNCKLCRIIGRDLGFIVVAHRFLQKLFKFEKVEHWILIAGRYWWETSPVDGYVGRWKKRVAVVEEDFWGLTFQSRKLLLLYNFYRFLQALYGQPFLFWSKLQRYPYMRGVSFIRDLVQVSTLLFFSHLFRVISPDNLSPYKGTLFHLSDFHRHAVWRC